MKPIIYSAPGGVILAGEEGGRYGKPILGSAIDKRVQVKVQSSKFKVQNSNDTIITIANTVKNFLEKKGELKNNAFYHYQIKSDIPISQNLGLETALIVAATAAFLEFLSGKQFPQEIINNLSHTIEKKIGKNPLGIETSVACFGGLIYFRRELAFLKGIYQLPFKIPQKIEEKLFLIKLNQSKRTIEQPKFNEKIFNKMEKNTKRMVVAIIKKDEKFFKQSMIDNQILREKLGIVNQRWVLSYAERKNRQYLKFKQSSVGVLRED